MIAAPRCVQCITISAFAGNTDKMVVENPFSLCYYIYTTIGGLSSKFDVFLAVRSQLDIDFSPPTCCQSATFVRPLFASQGHVGLAPLAGVRC